ncbi:hypothetical protein CK203_037668 [Vitis vinifera]|uniref:DUF4283 domain-containing protein n=1 Tax=Vitis vinifera TaxID=29760 RepID=A0A438HKH4_VITVI|nr:hypothetical protein CK203_037668 [Vitis vinifera]
MRESESEHTSEGKEGDSRAENRGKRKGSRFVVESKVLEVEAEERKGKIQVIISESKGELLSWVRLGPASVGLFIEGLTQCIRDGKEGRWEKGWKEKGRTYSLVREVNRVGCFIRLGVTDMEKRRFGICIPKGRGEKGGWASMVESLRNVGLWFEKKETDQEVKVSGRLYVEVVKGLECRDASRVRVEVKGEEIRGNVSRLEHCLVGKWNPRSAQEEDLERLGWSVAKAWGLKGKLGLARLGKGCALMEFEIVEEAKRVLASGERLVGGIQLGLEMWSPKFGCSSEGEARKKPGVLIKSNGEDLPSTLEIGVEGEVYALSLWWEISPSLRKKRGDDRDGYGRQKGEVRGDEEGMSVSGRASYKLATKLKVIKQNLKTWNREVFGSLESNKLVALQQVEYWDQVESERRLIEEETSIKKETKEGYAKWVNLEEIHWRQLSREIWLREGDRNTGYKWHLGGERFF